ncbi:MAG: CDP-diacylglycerol--serine O-phosphatidyltransferase [Deltaproteobacteria bacterium]|nr:CDP-diacylglycerol--serine O-phosphatidyltransferase [Deltaproteobacteria bacterium]
MDTEKEISGRKLSRELLKERWYRRRYLVPNAVTIGNMFCGFLAIMYSATNRYEKAALAIGIAILLDGLDGRVARRLNATSKFGLEFDSFSDLISFGVAPAILLYHWCFFPQADEFGVAVTFVYVICAASRLARFNIAAENLKSFVGCPTPGAAGFVAALVNFAPRVQSSFMLQVFGTIVMVSLAYLMVSRIEFFSVKRLKLSGMRLFARIALGALIALIWYNSGFGFLVLASAYVLSGPYGFVKRRNSPPAQMPGKVVQLAENSQPHDR